MSYASTMAVGALALGLVAFVEYSTPINSIATDGAPSASHTYDLRSGRSVFAPADEIGPVVTPAPDFFGSILTTR